MVDRHVSKMPTEYAQLLSTAHQLNGSDLRVTQEAAFLYWGKRKFQVVKPTHHHHPCAKWAAASQTNYIRLVRMMIAVFKEYEYRYGQYRKSQLIFVPATAHSPVLETHHETALKIEGLLWPPPNARVTNRITRPPLAMPSYLHHHSVVASYREYYNKEKVHLHRWKDRSVPPFIRE